MNKETSQKFPTSQPPQKQEKQPGIENKMHPEPIFEDINYNKSSGRLQGKVALLTGADSGIGRAVAVAFAYEGADIAVLYLDEKSDAEETKKHIEEVGKKCLLISGDIGDEDFCREAVDKVVKEYGHIDILVNNAAEQHEQQSIVDISKEQLERTFKTNVFGTFYITKAVLPHLKEGSSIINTTSVTAYRGSPALLDYSSTKGAILAFTRSLSGQLASKKIRVNGVAPGPIWTPLIPASFDEEKVSSFGKDVPLKRAGQPVEVAQAYVFLASDAASYISGQVIHVNGGEIVNG
ncbi:SDR family oxidoreductase [Clostridium polynesiense]|uniref:SDR family oxidoreductase n=1 Tax=Clostridium polynesiense TaxID=1325933 RepID=UPI00058E37FA|nr:SDR family oxidoreductase [Clostridium polynesiense]